MLAKTLKRVGLLQLEENAGNSNQGLRSIAIGQSAGNANLGDYSVAIGYGAGSINLSTNTIVLTADGSSATTFTTNTSGVFVTPMRNVGTSYGLYYNPTAKEITYAAQISELITPLSGASGTVDHNFSLGNVWNHTSISANFTANITNIPTTDDRSYTIVLNLFQGAIPYYANAIQINGSSPAGTKLNPVSPSPTANAYDRQTITIIRRSGNYYVMVKYDSFQ
jgi:hypothetical protein